jgi:hypothetical protein
MKPMDSRTIEELSSEEISEYFTMPPPKPLIYPEPEFCAIHNLWYITKCYRCYEETIPPIEQLEPFDYNCYLPEYWDEIPPVNQAKLAQKIRTGLCWCLISEKLLKYYFTMDLMPKP